MTKNKIWVTVGIFVAVFFGILIGHLTYPVYRSVVYGKEPTMTPLPPPVEKTAQAVEDTIVQSLSATPTIAPPAATPTATVEPVKPANPEVTNSNGWDITWFPGADLDRGDGTTFRSDAEKWNLREVAPELWPTFPNVPNPLVPEFRVVNGSEVPDGLEYAMDESNFCQQLAGEECRVPVAAMHYLYFTGDYDVPGIGSCSEDESGYGCMLVIVIVGRVTSDITGMFGQGFRLHARYWNGEALDMAMWALTSHGSNVMMNLDSPLNPSEIQNAGANCSVPEGCKGVDVRLVFTSGNELLVKYETQVSRK